MHSYANLNELATGGVILPNEEEDPLTILRVAQSVSQQVDEWVLRHFYIQEEDLIISGDGRRSLLIDRDIISVSDLAEDQNQDFTYSLDWDVAADIILYPYDSTPKRRLDVKRSSSKTYFTSGQANFRVTGKWGYSEDVRSANADLDGALDDSQTTMKVDPDSLVAPGMTVKIDSEQVYVKGASALADVFNVERGVNGTVAAAHLDDAPVTYYRYPAVVTEAVIMQTVRLFKRRDEGYSNQVGITAAGDRIQILGMDQDVKQMLKHLSLRGIRV